VEVHLRPVQIDGFAPGEIGAVRVEAVYGGQTCRVQAVRDPADSDHVVLEGELRGAPIPRLVLPVPSSGDAGLLSRLLIDARADRVYPTALARAARLLEAARG
jgi:hypothetical protein